MRNGIPDRNPDRRYLEQLWDTKLQQARERYCRAAAESFRCLLNRAGKPPVESSDAAGLRRAEAYAFAEYCRVLATFTELAAGDPPAAPSNLVVMPRSVD